jgi:hypothetical protein
VALVADAQYFRHGPDPSSADFAYPPTAGAVIFLGALLAITSTGTVQPIQESGGVAFAGMAVANSNTPAQPVVKANLGCKGGTWGIPVPGATWANLHANVYATDDNTLTLTAGSNLLIGTLAGIDPVAGTFVKLLGS